MRGLRRLQQVGERKDIRKLSETLPPTQKSAMQAPPTPPTRAGLFFSWGDWWKDGVDARSASRSCVSSLPRPCRCWRNGKDGRRCLTTLVGTLQEKTIRRKVELNQRWKRVVSGTVTVPDTRLARGYGRQTNGATHDDLHPRVHDALKGGASGTGHSNVTFSGSQGACAINTFEVGCSQTRRTFVLPRALFAREMLQYTRPLHCCWMEPKSKWGRRVALWKGACTCSSGSVWRRCRVAYGAHRSGVWCPRKTDPRPPVTKTVGPHQKTNPRSDLFSF